LEAPLVLSSRAERKASRVLSEKCIQTSDRPGHARRLSGTQLLEMARSTSRR